MKLYWMHSILLLLFLTACSHLKNFQTSSCGQTDWYEIGRQDGRYGESSEKIEKWFKLCKKSFNKTMYKIGHKKGLKQYCSPENAFQLGKTDIPYKKVCKTSLKSFLEAYKQGQNIFLEKERSFLEHSTPL